jgi:hypothetical protein
MKTISRMERNDHPCTEQSDFYDDADVRAVTHSCVGSDACSVPAQTAGACLAAVGGLTRIPNSRQFLLPSSTQAADPIATSGQRQRPKGQSQSPESQRDGPSGR